MAGGKINKSIIKVNLQIANLDQIEEKKQDYWQTLPFLTITTIKQ